MTSNAGAHSSGLDTAKLALSALLVGAGVVGFYYLRDQPQVVRVLSVLGSVVLAVIVSWQTAKGQQLLGFLRDSQIEVRRVVWPTRQETTQTTLLIIAVTLVAALFLWMLDALLGWLAKFATGLGG